MNSKLAIGAIREYILDAIEEGYLYDLREAIRQVKRWGASREFLAEAENLLGSSSTGLEADIEALRRAPIQHTFDHETCGVRCSDCRYSEEVAR